MHVHPSRVPFGLTQIKPRHFRDMLGIAWKNRDRAAYALRILREGVCDGCALGTYGVKDWTLEGTHLCMVRLNLLRLNTMPALDPGRLAHVGRLDELSGQALRDLGRLGHPMRRRRGDRGFRRISWDEALDEIAAKIRVTDPKRFALYMTSRGLTNETYYVAQKVARFLGTNNVDNAARLCHSPSTAGMRATVGVAASTCSYKDWIGTDLLVFFGSNVANDQPVSTKYIEEARRQGTQVVCVNTFREPGMDRYWIPSKIASSLFGSQITDRFYLVHTGGDIAFIYAVLKRLLEREAVDRKFIDDHTVGFDALAAALREASMETLRERSGATQEDIDDLADRLARARTAIFVWSMGITQHTTGADAVKAICDLGLVKGFVGRPKCGLMPIRGHSGVQGGAEMGAYATAFPGGKPIDEESARELSERYGFPVPSEPGLATVDMVERAREGEIDVFYMLGGNFLDTLPQPERAREALARVPLRVHQDIVVTHQMLVEPADTVILLPARTRYEQEGGGTETTTERRVVLSPEIRGPRPGEARTEWRILEEVAARTWPERAEQIRFTDADTIRREIAEAVPFYRGIEALARGGDSFQWGGPRLCEGWRFPLPDGKARFQVVPVPEPPTDPGDGTFRLATRRGKQFNSIVQADVDPLTGAARDAVFVSPDDAARLGLRDGDFVVLENEFGSMRGHARIAPMRSGNLQAHWPEANVLIAPGRVDAGGGVPDYNARVRMRRA